MIKHNNLSFENYVLTQKTSRIRALPTETAHKQNHLIRNHISEWLLHRFDWGYWVTLTFGIEPDLSEVQDILHLLHHKIDLRILKHTPDMSVMDKDARSKWILFPEYATETLHYHGFIQLNTHPTLGNSYENEWWWLDAAFRYQTETLSNMLSNGGSIRYKHFDRGWRTKDRLQMILYSMKEYRDETTHSEQNPSEDRFSHTIVSWTDWKMLPIPKHAPNKVEDIPPRADKVWHDSLESFFT